MIKKDLVELVSKNLCATTKFSLSTANLLMISLLKQIAQSTLNTEEKSKLFSTNRSHAK